MERTNRSAAALVDRATGPLAPHLGVFVASLIAQQYAASVTYIKALHALAFDHWLAKRCVVLCWLISARCRSSATSTVFVVGTNAFAPRRGFVSGVM